jgi:catechol 2,3-dioxygenase-like lactoylglutathione lyase family enzyme
MFDHIGLVVSDYARSVEFYDKALAPLGIRRLLELVPDQDGYPGTMQWSAFGRDQPQLWIGVGTPTFWDKQHQPARTPMHLALTAANRATVDAFHSAALKAGGRDLGAPGVRPHYNATYYAAYVRDPDGNNLEVVSHSP